MLLTIIRREVLDNLKSLRLTLTFVVVAILMITSGVLSVSKYQEITQDYSRIQNHNNAEMREVIAE